MTPNATFKSSQLQSKMMERAGVPAGQDGKVHAFQGMDVAAKQEKINNQVHTILAKELDDAGAGQTGNRNAPPDAPELTAPTMQTNVAAASAGGSKTELTAESNLLELLLKEGLVAQKDQSNQQDVNNAQHSATGESVAAALDSVTQMLYSEYSGLGKDKDALDAATAKSDDAKAEVQKATGDADAADNALAAAQEAEATAQRKLDGMASGDPGYAAAEADLKVAKSGTKDAKSAQTAAHKSLTKANSAMTSADVNVRSATATYNKELSRVLDKSPILLEIMTVGTSASATNEVAGTEAKKSAEGMLALITAMMSKLMDTSENSNAKANENLSKAMNDAAQKQQDNDIKTQQDSIAKSNKIHGILKVLMKVFTWAVTVISFAAAAVTGGASLVLASLALAFAIADEAVGDTTGTSLSERAMKPLMDDVITPLIHALSGALTNMLEKMGVSKDKAEMVGNILAAAVVAIGMIAVVAATFMLSKSAATKVIEKFGAKITKAVMKMVPKVLEDVARDAGKALGTALDKAISKAGISNTKLASNRLNIAAKTVDTANQLTQQGGNIGRATLQRDADFAAADVDLMRSASAQISKLLKDGLDQVSKTYETANKLFALVQAMLESQAGASKAIYSNLLKMA